ncbi:MAG: PaaI family thioesterase [Deltaproteobacteria bacterium]|nr:PaaI family thioesterase [Deltaproteobacteria bacterium]
MPRPSEILDLILKGQGTPPPFVHALRFPKIEGWEPGHVWAKWEVDRDFFHLFGAVFGGYLAALADQFVGLAMLSTLDEGERFTTSDLRYSFFRPVTGGTLTIDARVVHRGRRMGHVEAIFTTADGKVAGKATATQVIIPVREAD